jgi:hypothetical protein
MVSDFSILVDKSREFLRAWKETAGRCLDAGHAGLKAVDAQHRTCLLSAFIGGATGATFGSIGGPVGAAIGGAAGGFAGFALAAAMIFVGVDQSRVTDGSSNG